MRVHIRISTILVTLVMLSAYFLAYKEIGCITCIFQQPMLVIETEPDNHFPPEQYQFATLTKAQAYELICWARQSKTYFRNQFPVVQKAYALLGRRVPTFAQLNVDPMEVIVAKENAIHTYAEASSWLPSKFPSDPQIIETWSDEQKHELLCWALYQSNLSPYGAAQLPAIQKALEPVEPIKFRPMTEKERERELRYWQRFQKIQVVESEQNSSEVSFLLTDVYQQTSPPIDIPETQPMTMDEAFRLMAWADTDHFLVRYQLPSIQRAAKVLGYKIPTPEECQKTQEQLKKDSPQESELTKSQLRSKTPPVSVPLKELTFEQANKLKEWSRNTEMAIRMRKPIVQKALALLSTYPNTGVTEYMILKTWNSWPIQYRIQLHNAWSEANREDYTEQEWEFVQTVLQGIDLE